MYAIYRISMLLAHVTDSISSDSISFVIHNVCNIYHRYNSQYIERVRALANVLCVVQSRLFLCPIPLKNLEKNIFWKK